MRECDCDCEGECEGEGGKSCLHKVGALMCRWLPLLKDK